MLTWLPVIIAVIRTRIQAVRADDRGYTTETVIVTALLVTLALAVIAIIAAAVTDKANRILTPM
ncbi:MAG TPA: hypothetical protein VFQ77_19735 [Pseudonocardiaceae bacterium]|jgi:hypothetical protein|nr:hypothetical protein [Pseudonocardiaceae bacterium]